MIQHNYFVILVLKFGKIINTIIKIYILILFWYNNIIIFLLYILFFIYIIIQKI